MDRGKQKLVSVLQQRMPCNAHFSLAKIWKDDKSQSLSMSIFLVSALHTVDFGYACYSWIYEMGQ
jgi:hypothetical protein